MNVDSASSAFRRLSVAGSTAFDPVSLSRRRFLQAVSLGVAVPLAMGTLFDERALASIGSDPLLPGEGVLILVGMYGGNDGMNTVVPYASADYARRRSNIALTGTHDLNGRVGLHPALTTVKRLYDAGQVAVVQNVGVPNPDFSHFTSMASWMRGETSTPSGTGWLGRWLDTHADDVFSAVSLGSSVPLHLVGRSSRGTAVGFRGSMFGVTTNPAHQRHFDALRGFAGSGIGGWHDSIASAISLELDVARAVANIDQPAGSMPEIVAKMTMAARLVNADIGCRVVDVSWGGFDTHANELTDHGRRMAEFDAAIAALYATLDPSLTDRVTVMTWSEFGRTFSSTASGGTDHGSVNPLFVIGRNVAGGLFGDTPSLVGSNDRPQPTVDFRSVYTSVIDGWLGGGAAQIIGGVYSDLGLFRTGPGSDTPSSTPARPIGSGGAYVGIVPQRIFDSRNAIGTTGRRRIGPGERVTIAVAGVGAVPATGVTSVAVNITSTDATSDSYITAWPSDRSRPDTSNLNPRPGRTVPNFALVTVAPDGTISIFNERGSGHVIVDAVGYHTTSGGAGFVPLAPARIMDTRSGVGAPAGKVGPGRVIDLVVAGVGGVPNSGSEVAVLNVTATAADEESFVTVWPTGTSMPDASTLNMSRGRTVPNLVLARLGDGGRVSLFNSRGSTHLIADVVGHFSSGSAVRFTAVEPTRVLDTRRNLGASGPVGDRAFSLSLPGVANGTVAVVLNVTATSPTAESYATVWASGRARPGTSNLNYSRGDTVANAVIAEVGPDGRVQFANALGSVHLIADLVGCFVA
ncbi:MAG: DUF1501 domain-containing protein [Acidimicrobiia bacterium]